MAIPDYTLVTRYRAFYPMKSIGNVQDIFIYGGYIFILLVFNVLCFVVKLFQK